MTPSLAQAKEIKSWTKRLMVTPVMVSTYLGDSGYEAVYSGPRSVDCLVSTKRMLTADGSAVASELLLTIDEEDQEFFTPESKLVVNGNESKVISAFPVMYAGSVVFVKVVCS